MVVDKLREEFLDHVRVMVDYWNENDKTPDTKGKLNGLAFSIMSAIDGCSCDLPSYALVPIDEEQNIDFNNDIAGELHERLYKK